ncbi:actin-binding LIM protein 1 isoform X2 [Octopus bimaculoides]|uniref:actin-binding LIM protein 1 isoform X2 n=1 Tax=Octopus bimaculoides TaxID=37653 RepID=UPI00071CA252|nr:actin-binding LIM protein 1 isoform X2 [Octopus bimaculoides]|eukprot:XP_014769731.1 PREDICTED: actin-binding LIM protein 1-like isoform X2 [Octopus bimaculoides]
MGQKQSKAKDVNGENETQSRDYLERSSKRSSNRSIGSASRETTPANEQPAKAFPATDPNNDLAKDKSLSGVETEQIISPVKLQKEETVCDKQSQKSEPHESTPHPKSESQPNFDHSVPLTPLIVNDIENNHISKPRAASTPATANGMMEGTTPPLSPNSTTDHSDDEAYTSDRQCLMQPFAGMCLPVHRLSGVSKQDTSSLERSFNVNYGKFYNTSYLKDGYNSYMKRASINPKEMSKSSTHYCRPDNFSYSKEPTFLRNKQGGMMQLATSKTVKVRRSASPVDLKNDEAVRLSMFPAGKPPLPNEITKIEREDWPGPPSPAAILPEIMRQRRKSKGEEEEDTEEQPKEDPKKKKEFEEMSKLKDRSGLGCVIYKELAERKSLPPPPLDPWKASRVPSAKYEPKFSTRYQSPMFASPSRFLDRPQRAWDDGDIRACRSLTRITNYPVPKPGYGDYGISQRAATLPLSGMYGGALDFRYYEMDESSTSPTSSDVKHANHMDSSNQSDDRKISDSTISEDRKSKRSSYSRAGEPGVYDGPAVSLMTYQRNTWHTESEPPVYPYERLKITNFDLPKDVDRNCLEIYLAKEDFHELFKMSQEEFYRLAEWKRNDLKRRHHLY